MQDFPNIKKKKNNVQTHTKVIRLNQHFDPLVTCGGIFICIFAVFGAFLGVCV